MARSELPRLSVGDAARRRYARMTATLPRCGKPTRKGTPCTRPLVNGKCLTHDTMAAEARAELCRMIAPLGASAGPRGAEHPAWKGDRAQRHSGRHRAQRLYPLRPCEVCGADPAGGEVHRHHRDGNPLNNARDNIAFLCVRHHADAHGGRFTWFDPNNER